MHKLIYKSIYKPVIYKLVQTRIYIDYYVEISQSLAFVLITSNIRRVSLDYFFFF